MTVLTVQAIRLHVNFWSGQFVKYSWTDADQPARKLHFLGNNYLNFEHIL
jgi:hypothetical protein